MKFTFSKSLVVNSKVEPWKSEGIRIAFYSAPGTRKSYTVAACIIEPFLDEGGTVVVFQPRSEWHTLKQKYESIVVVGGPFQDIPLVVNQAKVYAEAIVNHGISIVFDFSETEDKDLVRFAAELLARLYTLQNTVRRPLLLFLEELAEYCPLRTTGKLVEPWVYDRMKSRIIKISTQGRPLGFNLAFTSQRPAQLDYTVRMMANLSFYGKFHPKDLNDIKEVLKPYDIPIKETAEKCVNMPHGSWIAITAEQILEITITTKRTTPHGADTPTLEYEAPKTKQTQQTMTELTKTITEALKQQQQEESEVVKLKRDITDLKKKLAKAEEQAKIKLAVQDLLKGNGDTTKLAEELTYTKTELLASKANHSTVLRQLRELEAKYKPLAKLHEAITEIVRHTEIDLKSQPKATNIPYEHWVEKLPSKVSRKILQFLIDHRGLKFTQSQIALQTGYKNTSGTFRGGFKVIRDNNLAKTDGNHWWVE